MCNLSRIIQVSWSLAKKEKLCGFVGITKIAQTVENQSCHFQDQGELHGTHPE
jgi:hypothetical protein